MSGQPPLLTSSLVKFLVMPITTFLAARLLGLGSHAFIVALIFQSLLTASSSYIMTRQLGENTPLITGIIAIQTALAALAIPLVLAILAG